MNALLSYDPLLATLPVEVSDPAASTVMYDPVTPIPKFPAKAFEIKNIAAKWTVNTIFNLLI